MKREDNFVTFTVRDTGVGIHEAYKNILFDGLITTRDTMAYSTKTPFEFNAGGRGLDLLRTKVFSKRYNFKIEMETKRCIYLPSEKDLCPGDIRECPHCRELEANCCYESGGTTMRLLFPIKETRP